MCEAKLTDPEWVRIAVLPVNAKAAACVLRQIPDPAGLEPLLALAAKPECEAWAVFEAIGCIGGERAFEFLREILVTAKPDHVRLHRALHGVRRLKDPRGERDREGAARDGEVLGRSQCAGEDAEGPHRREGPVRAAAVRAARAA